MGYSGKKKDLGFLQDHIVIWLVLVKTKISDWVERNFCSLAVFGGNLLAGDVHSSVATDRDVQSWQWTGSILQFTWGLPWASACLLEAWGDTLVFLLLQLLLKTNPATNYVHHLCIINILQRLGRFNQRQDRTCVWLAVILKPKQYSTKSKWFVFKNF